MSATFFKRGSGPLVSVILPTRGRPGPLMQAIDSLVSLAQDPGCMEFLFRVDDDDLPTIDTLTSFQKSFPQFPVKLVIGPRGNGYHDIWKWDNDLASRATGDWLFIFNDDALMRTEKWDHTLMHLGSAQPWPGIQDVCMVIFPTIGRPIAQEFFCVRRRMYDILGHLFLSCHGDNWLYGISHFLGTFLVAGVNIEHNSGTIGDQTRKDSEEAYKESIVSLIGTPALWERCRDLTVLLTHMSKCESLMQWSPLPAHPGWWYWRRTPDTPTRAVVVDNDGRAIRFNLAGTVESTNKANTEGGLWSPVHP